MITPNTRLKAFEHAAERAALGDRALMRAMIGVIRDALHGAVCEVEAMSVELAHVDGGQLMADVRHAFDPTLSTSMILDAFLDGFQPTWRARLSAHHETLWDKDETAACLPKEPVDSLTMKQACRVMTPQWNPRFVAYARAIGVEPEAVKQHDGGMIPFMLWNRGKWAEWKASVGHKGHYLTPQDHAAYDAWLAQAYPEVPNAR